MRSSRLAIAVRSILIVFVIYMLLAWLWNTLTETVFWTPLEMAISAVLTVVLYGGFAWLVTNLGMGILFGRRSDYRRYREHGGDPYFDSLPWPFNPDSVDARQIGNDEAKSPFTPPASWRYECPVCGARQPSRICVCWNCNYGADGDSTAYFQQFGDVKPSDMTEEQWAGIRKHSHQ